MSDTTKTLKITNFAVAIFLFAISLAFVGGFRRAVYAAAPKCYTYDGKVETTCEGTTPQPDKCYVEDRGGPNGVLRGYNETDCANPTSRSVNGTPAGQTGVGGNTQGDCTASGSDNLTKDNCGIVKYVLDGINILSGLVGVAVVTMIAIGGIQYSTARDNPQATAAAKARIINAILALVAYLFLWAILQYLIPGGVLK